MSRELVVRRRVGKVLLFSGMALLVPVAMYLWLQTTGDILAQPNLSSLQYDWSRKITQLFTFTRGYRWRWDVLPTVLLGGIVAYCLWRTRKRSFRSIALWPAIGLATAYVVLPTAVSANTGSGLDVRFYWPAVVMTVLALPTEGWGERERRAILFLTGLVWTLRIAELQFNWWQLSNETVRMLAVLRQLPEGARVYPILQQSGEVDAGKRDMALAHVVSYMVAEKKIVNPALFAVPGAQPIIFRHALPYASAGKIEFFDHYEHIWSLGQSAKITQYLQSHAKLLGEAAGFRLWQLRQDDPTKKGSNETSP